MKKTVFLGLLAMVLTFGLIGCDIGNGTTTYTVTFNSNSGSIVHAVSGITSGSTITLPENPTRGNDKFDGWFADNVTFLDQFTASTVITSNLTVYAKWTININYAEAIIGKWIYTKHLQSYQGNMSFEYFENGQVQHIVDVFSDGVITETITLNGTYLIKSNRIEFNFDDVIQAIDFELNDNILILKSFLQEHTGTGVILHDVIFERK